MPVQRYTAVQQNNTRRPSQPCMTCTHHCTEGLTRTALWCGRARSAISPCWRTLCDSEQHCNLRGFPGTGIRKILREHSVQDMLGLNHNWADKSRPAGRVSCSFKKRHTASRETGQGRGDGLGHVLVEPSAELVVGGVVQNRRRDRHDSARYPPVSLTP